MKIIPFIAGLAFSASASPPPPDAQAGTLYATDVIWTNNGTVGSGNNRDVKANALGAPDQKFLSLGKGGMADFTFGQLFTGPGVSYEVTFARSNYLERPTSSPV